jgi:hypothetical protein
VSLCLTKHHAMKTYWGSGGIVPRIFSSARDGGEWSASRPGRFTTRERAPSTHCTGGWVGPRAVLDTVVKRKILSPAGNRTLEHRSPNIPYIKYETQTEQSNKAYKASHSGSTKVHTDVVEGAYVIPLPDPCERRGSWRGHDCHFYRSGGGRRPASYVPAGDVADQHDKSEFFSLYSR